MKKTEWRIRARRADFYGLAARFSISPYLARLMVNRGVNEEEFDEYLNGTLDHLPDPLLLKDMDRAAEILLRKRDGHRKIRVIGDYDIDGICATYILLTGLREIGAEADYDIPDRIQDGYGLNVNLVRRAKEEGADTILTCDNGIAALEEIREAKRLGMTVVVTDHHEVGHGEDGGELLPEADAVVDPKRSDSTYPFRDICGAAVAWKLIGVLYEQEGISREKWMELLPFAAIATVGDVMPLRAENRKVVREGLKAVGRTKNVGLRKLTELCRLDPENLTAFHIGFVIGPCLNAGGRLESAKVGLSMLLEPDPQKAEQTAQHLKFLNDERKRMTNEGTEEAVRQAEELYPDQNVQVIYLKNCHESVAGIIAGRLREHCYRPSIVLTDSASEDCLKGSGRSIEAYHMFRGLEEVKDLLLKFGGHPAAAGLTIRRENLEELRRRLNGNAVFTEDQLTEKLWIDIELPFSRLTEEFLEELTRLEPCGQGNEKVMFAQRKVRILDVRVMGKDRNVVKTRLMDQEGTEIDGIIFRTDGETFMKEMGDRREFSILYYPSVNEYMGRRTIQAVLQGWKF